MSRARIAWLVAALVAAAGVALAVRPGAGPDLRAVAPHKKPTPSQEPTAPQKPSPPQNHSPTGTNRAITSWAYQLQDYPGGRLDQLAAGPFQLVVIDLARDANTDYFTAPEIARVQDTGKKVLAYFEIGSIEDFRPEYPALRRDTPGLIANEWTDWPGEYFVRYWDQRWWDRVVRPRVDRALTAGFDGVYLDTPLAYEELALSAAQGRDRDALARDMADLVKRISRYAKDRRPGFLIVPQNSPELRHQPGYTAAVDGIGIEELFFEATDRRCAEDYCAENLAETRALRDSGKFVLGVDYATSPADVRAACARYRAEDFAGTVTVVDLDRTAPPCA